MDGFLVRLKEQAVLAAEMLKNRALCDAQHCSQVTDAGSVVALLGEVPHRGVNNTGSFALRTVPGRLATIAWGRNNRADTSAHSLTSSHGTLLQTHSDFNSVFCCRAVV